MLTILVAVNDFTDAHVQQIQQAAEGWAQIVRIDQTAPQAVYDQVLSRCDIVVGWPHARSLVDSPIRFTQLCSAGYDPYLRVPLHQKQGFVLCNARGVFSIAAAEQTLAMMFALTRRLNLHIRDQTQHRWQRDTEYRIVDGDTLCVVGLGSIGAAIAERAAGIGMNVIAVTRTGKEQAEPPVSKIYAFDALDQAIHCADHVVLSIPASASTTGLFNEAMFRRMKPGSCFYNVGRGSLVVESDLVKVLRDGHLWGAGLDVFENEPLPPGHPFWDMSNVIVLPHTAGRYVQEFDRLCELFTDNLMRYHRGQPMSNVIDLNVKH